MPLSTEHPDHPLFPVEEGEQNPQVTFIQITRHDRGVQKYGPVIPADQLTTLEEIFEMYGGGHYELWARGPSKMKPGGPGNVTRKRRFVLPGRSKPLSKDPTPEELRESELSGGTTAAPATATAAPSSSAGAGAMSDANLLIAMMNMQQQNAQQFAQMMMAMLQSSKAESAEIAKSMSSQQQQMTTMMLTLASQNQQAMMQFLAATMGNKGTGPDDLIKLGRAIKELSGGAKDGEPAAGEGGFGKMIEDAADFVQGLTQLRGALPTPGTIPAVPEPNGTAPAGSATALADAMIPKT